MQKLTFTLPSESHETVAKVEVEPESKRDIVGNLAVQQLCVSNGFAARLQATAHMVDALLDLLVIDFQYESVVGMRQCVARISFEDLRIIGNSSCAYETSDLHWRTRALRLLVDSSLGK